MPGVALLDGVEYRTAFSRALGYGGVLHGGGALTGRRVRAIWDSAGAGNLAAALALDRQNALFLAGVYTRFSRPLQNTIRQKYALKLLGVLDHETTLVEQHLDEGSKSRIAAIVESHRDWLVGSPDPDCPDADLA